jgi:hypothetical protein
MPPHPMPKASVTSETLAHIIVSKYIDGLPLYRLESIFGRGDIEIRRDQMARWVISIGEMLLRLKLLLHKRLISSGSMAMDETTLQVLKEKGRRADQKSYMVVQSREGPPGKSITIFHYEKSRASAVLARYLDGFEGSLITDGLAV